MTSTCSNVPSGLTGHGMVGPVTEFCACRRAISRAAGVRPSSRPMRPGSRPDPRESRRPTGGMTIQPA
ncbi:MAG: hypothetical protein OXI15_19125, partial [Chromatiales bacterium]|nr:hypothetical protein [Chromatiales bacterium]